MLDWYFAIYNKLACMGSQLMRLLPNSTVDRVTVVLFGAGFVLVATGLLIVEGRLIWKAGAACWLVAYFIVVVENFHSRRPVQTRGGVIRAEAGRMRYLAPYISMFFIGAVAAIILITA
ncbi:hypothetical protein E4K72_11695 [Oxalobacteraceae bacterium OM1]|nr:hypothetical protein E4K72_11695 [Oxalobacteraceae bacterium OM1]